MAQIFFRKLEILLGKFVISSIKGEGETVQYNLATKDYLTKHQTEEFNKIIIWQNSPTTDNKTVQQLIVLDHCFNFLKKDLENTLIFTSLQLSHVTKKTSASLPSSSTPPSLSSKSPYPLQQKKGRHKSNRITSQESRLHQ